ncbi:MAG TPA: phosphoenolpyruvate--protein phosphotransferase, partial [Pseudonocardia sp.]|nr:phosphoenolpyruvate--protein phosphotransferase [Pseudonocardia sp.]
ATDPADVPTAAWHRSERATAAVRAAVERLRNDTAAQVGPAEAAIFDAHLLLLEDAELLADVRRRIDAGTGPARSWLAATAAVAADLAALPGPYLRERAADVRSIGAAMARELLGRPAAAASPAPVRGGILLAEDLSPAQVATLDPARIRGIVLAAGSPTGHGAILARARGIPTVVAAGPVVATIAEGTRLALDGSTGELLVDPGPERIAEFEHRRDTAAATATAALAVASAAAVTVDGEAVPVGANVGSPADAAAAAAGGADLAGLVRTEFLFLGRTAAPDVDEQVAAYRGLAAALGGRRLTLRTLDVGGDKPLPYAPQAREANPFLGVRGIRFALAERELLRTQLQAVVRVAQETPISVMFPMVTTLDELVAARQALDDAVRAAGRGTPPGLQVGIMVEVPAAALRAATFAPLVDFLSIGTNDLTQYALAAERGHPGLAALGDPLDPAVLALVAATCRAAAGGPLVAVCGELAADERATRLLVALGVRELSVTPPAIPAIKAAVRRIERADDAELVRRALAAPSAAAVRDLLAT